MPVQPLAASFQGLGGATALSLIAFSVVFLVLLALTFVIFGMRYVSVWGSKPKAAPKAAAKAPAAPKSTQVPVESAPSVPAGTDDDELVAVITAAIAEYLGTAVAVTSIAPAAAAAGHQIGTDSASWIAIGRIEGLQGALPERW